MLSGKVIRFDEVRGYGFIAPDGGGEDVFVHANVLGDDKYVFGPGLRVEFEVTDGDRGPKAHAVHLVSERGPALAAAPVAPPVIPPGVQVAAPPVPLVPPVTSPAGESAPGEPAAAAEPRADAAPTATSVSPAPADGADDELCDVLTAPAFSQEITELLLKSAPTVTAAQILNMRAELMQFGRRHGWIED